MIAVIGDIHGCYYTLCSLVEDIHDKYGKIDLYSVGDLIDRGKYSDKVISFCIDEGVKPVLGNHDCMFLYHYRQPEHIYASLWTTNGHYQTLKSYIDKELLRDTHLDYIQDLPLFYNLEQCLITHAGISSLFSAELQGNENWDGMQWEKFISERAHDDLGVLWNRSSLMNLGKCQIVGHTRQASMNYSKSNLSFYIDTGAYSGNCLTAIVLDGNLLAESISIPVIYKDIQ